MAISMEMSLIIDDDRDDANSDANWRAKVYDLENQLKETRSYYLQKLHTMDKFPVIFKVCIDVGVEEEKPTWAHAPPELPRTHQQTCWSALPLLQARRSSQPPRALF